MALSTALRTSIPVLHLLREVGENMPGIINHGTTIGCTIYEDDESAIRMAHSEKESHRTKHISTKIHHFRQYVRSKEIRIMHVPSAKQVADIFTKPLSSDVFVPLRQKLMG